MDDEADEGQVAGLGDLGVEQTILPSPNLVVLDPTPRERYLARFDDARGDVAETFFLNTQVRPGELESLPDPDELSDLREWFLSSRRAFDVNVIVEESDVPQFSLGESQQGEGQETGGWLVPQLAQLLRMFGPDQPMAASLFNVDLNLITPDAIYLLPPRTDSLIVERRGTALVERIASNLRAHEAKELLDCPWILSLSLVPHRTMVVLGPRGARMALMETGVLLANLVTAVVRAGLQPFPFMHFSDWGVDQVLENDGLERTCIALVGVRTPPVHPEAEG